MKNKKFTRMVAMLLCSLLLITGLVGCGSRGGQTTIDNERTQLYVNTFLAGLGDRWVQEYATAFEEFYKDTSFEEGKKGVQVVIDYTYSSGLDTLKDLVSTRSEVIWAEQANYTQIVAANIAYDISDWVTEPLTEFGEDVTIEDKMDDSLVNYYRGVDGKMYALPWFTYLKGVIYDLDIFEGKQSAGHGFYFAKDGGFTSGLAGQPAKSAGPDNVIGTYDDGLPATHAQFFEMMNEMIKYGIVPFSFPGMYEYYMDTFIFDLWVNDEGSAGMLMNNEYTGTANNLINVSNGVVTPIAATEITNENAYMLLKSESRYRAYEFANKLVKNSRYYSEYSFNGSQSQLQAEETLLYNVIDGKEKVAMLTDGVWWESEVYSIFASMANNNSAYSRQNRRFGWMPMPYYDEAETGEVRKQTMAVETDTTVIVKKNIAPEKVELAKKYIQFTSTDRMILEHAKKASAPRGLNISNMSIIDTDTELTAYEKSVLEFKNNTELIQVGGKNKFKWHTGFGFLGTFKGALINGAVNGSPIMAFRNNTATPETYFNGMYANIQPKWANYLKTYNG